MHIHIYIKIKFSKAVIHAVLRNNGFAFESFPLQKNSLSEPKESGLEIKENELRWWGFLLHYLCSGFCWASGSPSLRGRGWSQGSLSVTSLDPGKRRKHTCEAGQPYFFQEAQPGIDGEGGELVGRVREEATALDVPPRD